ncbi:plasmid replication protein RepC [Rhizobium sp. Root483D2]|uniref:plasmid replication protein RepC n=1 Tax=Rhizobium sp. Root483D2 TaxID=1736545 RepID=UPI00071496C0|nr:plasmid replication protein RepC [Rhizobium sp. Root483D2]KQY42621.1 replication initiation protein RepC [Rhizobium sp. Root483D2]
MQLGSVTTPFGRRPMTLAHVRQQVALADIKPGKTADKWKILRDASASMSILGIQSNSLAVLDALLSFHPETELREGANLIVFPSNIQLALRAHGMAGATLRRHLAILVDAGLIARKDSANGKRYARKGSSGNIEKAFGFDLSPLLARAEELAISAQQVMADRVALKAARENLTICRRDTRKLISAALAEGADGDWLAIEAMYITLVEKFPASPTLETVTDLLGKMQRLQEEVLKRLTFNEKSGNLSSNDSHIEQHIQNSHTNYPTEFEPSVRTDLASKSSDVPLQTKPMKNFPLGLVLRACPAILDYGPGGDIGNWRDLISAAVVVRSVLGVSPAAYQDACMAMGQENAAVAMAAILERASLINSAGGYLRDLTRRAERGEFSLGPMVMALIKSQVEEGRRLG